VLGISTPRHDAEHVLLCDLCSAGWQLCYPNRRGTGGAPEPDIPYTGASVEAAADPLLNPRSGVRITRTIKSTEYLANVRGWMFSEIAEVNDYSKESHAGLPEVRRGSVGRMKLENIIQKLAPCLPNMRLGHRERGHVNQTV
jgi:hypothetical protein